MPNPKVGTVTMDVTNAVKGAKGGSVEFRVEKAGIVQAGVGKASFGAEKLVQNIKAFADAVQKAKPAGAKGTVHQSRRGVLDHGPGRQGGAFEPVHDGSVEPRHGASALRPIAVIESDHKAVAPVNTGVALCMNSATIYCERSCSNRSLWDSDGRASWL